MESHTPLKTFIGQNIGSWAPFAVSTNKLYRFCFSGRHYVLKQPHERADGLSPFWQSMQDIFGSTFAGQRRNVAALVDTLAQNPHIPAAPVVCTDETLAYQVFEEVPGLAYAPDIFPNSASLLHQLGQYVGFLHQSKYPQFGVFPPDGRNPTFDVASFGLRLRSCMQRLIGRHWAEDTAVAAYFRQLPLDTLQVGSFSLMMPDISANQFVFAPTLDCIRAVVDYDAYVLGPREWELAVLELCMQDGTAFRQGYESYAPLPDLSATRAIYRFLMYLCDPWESIALEAFLAQPAVLAG